MSNRDEYERDLARRRKEHFDQIDANRGHSWKPCAHDSCSQCLGTGIKTDGSMCVHALYCDCPRCSPR